MEIIELKTQIRKTTGNGPARALRRHGRIPAVLYGPGQKPVLLSVDKNELEGVVKGRQVSQLLLNLIIQNGRNRKRTAMIKELQANPVTRNFLHVDFYEVAMDRKIRVSVPVVPLGKAKGVENGGILQVIRRELEVLCLPSSIPEKFEIDISHLDIGDAIHVEDIPRGENVEIPADTNFTVITVVAPKVEAEVVTEEEVEGEEEAQKGVEGTPETESEE
ncbi:MAG: 50S ribosomal protein L25/general stress protein Ctc [Deltaproteobacteria bacterium]|nr:50S ribosomal protein L25/general stress protein Ctc [Deltaproteobacteria bacterium]MBW2151905.1 50S ribosomal protein L25/general stress protein Ctc [Deltaproteobacteria bacterium]